MTTFHHQVDKTAEAMQLIANIENKKQITKKKESKYLMRWIFNKPTPKSSQSKSKSVTPKSKSKFKNRQRKNRISREDRMTSALGSYEPEPKMYMPKKVKDEYYNYKKPLSFNTNWDVWAKQFKYWYPHLIYEISNKLYTSNKRLYKLASDNPNFVIWCLSYINQFEPYAWVCLAKLIIMCTNGASERSLAKLTKIGTPARNRMTEDTLNNHDTISMYVIDEYSNSKNTAKWAQAPIICRDFIQESGLKHDIPVAFHRCQFEIHQLDHNIS